MGEGEEEQRRGAEEEGGERGRRGGRRVDHEHVYQQGVNQCWFVLT